MTVSVLHCPRRQLGTGGMGVVRQEQWRERGRDIVNRFLGFGFITSLPRREGQHYSPSQGETQKREKGEERLGRERLLRIKLSLTLERRRNEEE